MEAREREEERQAWRKVTTRQFHSHERRGEARQSREYASCHMRQAPTDASASVEGGKGGEGSKVVPNKPVFCSCLVSIMESNVASRCCGQGREGGGGGRREGSVKYLRH